MAFLWFRFIFMQFAPEYIKKSFIDSICHHFIPNFPQSRIFLQLEFVNENVKKKCMCENYQNLRRKYFITYCASRNHENRSTLFQMQCPFRSCLRGWPKTNQKTLLHQQCFDWIHWSWNSEEKLETSDNQNLNVFFYYLLLIICILLRVVDSILLEFVIFFVD